VLGRSFATGGTVVRGRSYAEHGEPSSRRFSCDDPIDTCVPTLLAVGWR